MQGIELFLKKYLTFEPPERIIQKALVQAVEEVTKIKIQENNCLVREKTVFIEAEGIVKSEIHLHKKEIEERATQLLGGRKRAVQ